MKKFLLVLFLILSASIAAQTQQYSEIAGRSGSFSRMGFGARGMGMGNAMSAITDGELVSYYNPALSSFQNGKSFQTSYSFLSLDRSLNFINFTTSFGGDDNRKGVPGISLGIINSGVSGIDGRTSSGVHTEDLSTSENQFFIGLSNKFSNKLALGIAFKFYYYSLYDEVSASSLGFDIGALYFINKHITLSLMFSDLNSKYEWDTSDLYGSSGNSTTSKFPLLKKIGVSYKFDDPKIIAAIELESSNAGTDYLRFGAEYNIYEGLFLRGGMDQFNLSNTDEPVKPAAGFSYFYPMRIGVVGVNYAFVIEPYSSHDQHIVGVNINF